MKSLSTLELACIFKRSAEGLMSLQVEDATWVGPAIQEVSEAFDLAQVGEEEIGIILVIDVGLVSDPPPVFSPGDRLLVRILFKSMDGENFSIQLQKAA